MAIRYVWGKYNVETETSYSTRTSKYYQYEIIDKNNPIAQYSRLSGDIRENQDGNARFCLSTGRKNVPYLSGVHLLEEDFGHDYVVPNDGSNGYGSDGIVYGKAMLYNTPFDDGGSNDGSWWVQVLSSGGTSYAKIYLRSNSVEMNYDFDIFYNPIITHTRGKYLEEISRTNPSSYPKDGVSGNGWYVYKGSDSIDPTAVTYSTNDLYPNEPVTITVTPVTPTYGGTIYYQYQYSINGGSTWTNLGSRTTDTSKTMTIPEGATQFRARVTASDGWGFTSTTPVLGANLGVSQLKAFATLDALYRSGVKMYATVDGKIREITKGYATVNGVIRKMF